MCHNGYGMFTSPFSYVDDGPCGRINVPLSPYPNDTIKWMSVVLSS